MQQTANFRTHANRDPRGRIRRLYAALQLERTVARNRDVEVLLIDPQNFLLFTPMLHQVASGSLYPTRSLCRSARPCARKNSCERRPRRSTSTARTVTVAYGLDRRTRMIRFDHLLIAAGSQTRFPATLRPHVHGMKTIHDALMLRSWLIGNLERAEIEEDAASRRALLTIAVAGGGFSGVETIGAINDFLRQISRHYPGPQRNRQRWPCSSPWSDCCRNSSRHWANTRRPGCAPPASTCACARK